MSGEMVIVAYRPKPGCEDGLMALLRAHVPALRALGLATGRGALLARAADGTVVEMFEWVAGGAAAAHEDPAVLRMWGQYAEVCDYVKLRDLPEAAEMFASFAPID